jgi:hypothetical protein
VGRVATGVNRRDSLDKWWFMIQWEVTINGISLEKPGSLIKGHFDQGTNHAYLNFSSGS